VRVLHAIPQTAQSDGQTGYEWCQMGEQQPKARVSEAFSVKRSQALGDCVCPLYGTIGAPDILSSLCAEGEDSGAREDDMS
jgi:hypothetical protein